MQTTVSPGTFSALAILLAALLVASNAGATLIDDEDANDTCCSSSLIQMTRPSGDGVPPFADTGRLVLRGADAPCEDSSSNGDVDYVGIGNLKRGDVITVSTTPQRPKPDACPDDEELGPCNGALDVPDTIVALFNDDGLNILDVCYGLDPVDPADPAPFLCDVYSDDAENNFAGWNGGGSLIRYRIQVNGDYYVGVTGYDDEFFEGCHPDPDLELDPIFGPDTTTGVYGLSISVYPKLPPRGGCGLGVELGVLMPLLLRARGLRRRRPRR